MQIKSLRVKSYRSFRVNDTKILDVGTGRIEKIKLFDKLKAEGCSEQTALIAIKASRATLYRWKRKFKKEGSPGLNPKNKRPTNIRKPCWTRELQLLVYQTREKYPCWGKYKIQKILEKENRVQVSVATIGRIISFLIKKGTLRSVTEIVGHKKGKRKRVFDKHAQRWRYEMRGKSPGEMVQIDHMTVNFTGGAVKHFKAVCPVSKMMIAEVYSNATSATAARFLEKVIAELPFKIHSIQVDGGSEFMRDFESACQKKEIPLFVLPPRSPKYNGVVERCNGITRNEFYSQYQGVFNVTNLRVALQDFQNLYNYRRPHQGLGYLTAVEYLETKFGIEAA